MDKEKEKEHLTPEGGDVGLFDDPPAGGPGRVVQVVGGGLATGRSITEWSGAGTWREGAAGERVMFSSLVSVADWRRGG
jgi:hypothetical protein